MTGSSPARHAWALGAAVVSLVAVYLALALAAAAHKGVTVDEIFHVTGGYFFDKFGDYRLHPENGVLPQRLHALPAVLAGAKPPPTAGNEYLQVSDMYVVAHQFFYESGNDHGPMLMQARRMNLLFAVGLLVLVWGWAHRLGGPVAGLAALALAVFSPTMLAHGPLATTDMAAALMLNASAGGFWWALRRGGSGRLALSSLAFGVACVAKYSAVLLLPVFALLLVADHWSTPRAARRPGRALAFLAVHGAAACAVIWTCYGFRYSAFSPALPPADQFIIGWDWMLSRAGWQGGVLGWVRDHHLLPEAFLFGYAHTYVSSLSRSAFLAGEYSITGWRLFFPLAFSWKSTPAELAGGLLALGAAWRHRRRLGPWLARLWPLLLLGLAYGGAALASHLNIGHRHLLPLYPGLFILAGLAAARVSRSQRAALALAAVLALAQAATAVRIHPDYLAYFNPLAGGPANGWRLLVDSSLDWGQDLPGLKDWLQRHNTGPGAERVYLSYFGSDEPDYYGLSAERLPFVNGFKFRPTWVDPGAGLYCVSATMLQQVYSPAGGEWTLANEREYQDLRRLIPQFQGYFCYPAIRAELVRTVPAEKWERIWNRFEALRLARLCPCLRARRPEAMVGYSILIYRLSAADVDMMLNRSYSEWLRAAYPAGRD